MPNNKLELNGGNMTFTQPADCCSSDGYQTLDVEIHDGGGGKYFLIKTEGWAFDSILELTEILNRVGKAFDIQT